MIVPIFERAREETRRQAPSFEATWSAAKRGGSRRIGPWAVLAPSGAAAVLALVALLLGPLTGPFSVDERRMAAELSAWSASSDVLLGDFDLGLPAGTPELGGSLERLRRQIETNQTRSRR